MELPNYRLPGAKNVTQLIVGKSKRLPTARIYGYFYWQQLLYGSCRALIVHLNMVTDSADSMLAASRRMCWCRLFRPLGMGDWRICTALISGFMAKESVVSTLGSAVRRKYRHGDHRPLTAASILVFSLLYTPCVAAIASVKRELGSKWALGVVIWQCVIAWLAALVVHLIGLMIGLV